MLICAWRDIWCCWFVVSTIHKNSTAVWNETDVYGTAVSLHKNCCLKRLLESSPHTLKYLIRLILYFQVLIEYLSANLCHPCDWYCNINAGYLSFIHLFLWVLMFCNLDVTSDYFLIPLKFNLIWYDTIYIECKFHFHKLKVVKQVC